MNTSSKPRAVDAHGLVRLSNIARVSELLGQETGRAYVEEFVRRLKGMMRKRDRLVKLSTDKYCIVFNGVRERNLVELAAAKLERSFEAPVDLFGESLYFKLHAGFALPEESTTDTGTLIKHAESALRTAQARDRLFVIYSADELKVDHRNPALVARMRKGVNRGEFVLYYQPKVSAAFSTVVGAEGLVRWHDSDNKRVIEPEEFIETAEQSSIIEDLTEQMLRSAVARCSRWDSSIGVAVNVTPRLFENAHFVQIISDILDFYSLPPPRLTLEVTERGVLTDAAMSNLQALRDLGTIISIDDFGTGLCSLAYFRDLPADQIKIDTSFVHAMRKSKKDLAIVRGSIDLAHYCEMQVVAEGVEDEQTAKMLANMGCDVLQGFLYDKPLEAEEFETRYLAGLYRSDDPDLHSELINHPSRI